MSGICGIAFHDKGVSPRLLDLSAMVRALSVSASSDGSATSLDRIALGAQEFPGRLAGVRELRVDGTSSAIAFHGSLFDQSAGLSSNGHAGDVLGALLRAYLKDGADCLRPLRGEFALAIWDGARHTLHLATDRWRVHPLFYYVDGDKLIFASRLKSVLAGPLPIKTTIDPEALVDMVASSVIPTPRTIFREVRKLPPGNVLSCSGGRITIAPYWDVSFLQPDASSEAELARSLKTHFADAIAVRLAQDAGRGEIGTFLSGGVDSSTVTGVLTHVAGHPIKTFSIGFDEQRFNEISYARAAAQAFGAEHHEYFVSPADVRALVPTLLDGFDEPYGNASAIPTYFCANLARSKGVDVLYAGDGGDELFAGNERYATQRLFDRYFEIPAWFREPILKRLVFTLADRLRAEVLVKAKKYIARASIGYPGRLSSYGFFNIVPMTSFLHPGLVDALGKTYDPYGPIAAHYQRAPAATELDRQLYIDLKYAIGDNDLFKVTRMTESAGVTVRFPFLDPPLAEFATRVPAALKMRGTELRSFFKKAYSDVLPQITRAKKKHGFGVPISVWLRTDTWLNDLMHELVLGSRTLRREYFQKSALEALLDQHRTDETSFSGSIIWNLMMLELWLRRHEEQPAL